MPSVTLAESAKLCQDELIAGVIETIVTVDQFYELLPFEGIEGNALAYNREVAMGGVQFGTVGTKLTDAEGKAPATFSQHTARLTTIFGDAEINGLIKATRSNINDQEAIQVASKAKNIGMQFRSKLIAGDGTGETFTGLLGLCANSQKLSASGTAGTGAPLTFEHLDELLDMVVDKSGIVDYMMMPSKILRDYYKLLRALGGATIGDVVTLPSGTQVPAYRGVPIFRNDNIPTNMTGGTTAMFAGTLDDGSGKYGISGLTAMGENAGIGVEYIGTSHDKDEYITRVKFYCGLACYSELGLAALTDLK